MEGVEESEEVVEQQKGDAVQETDESAGVQREELTEVRIQCRGVPAG